ncbi:MAG: biotin/lipoyl-binding protein, partial [Nevskia sp.]|nr:biotin/lipoyl-binding protein [Nevskia sp.]
MATSSLYRKEALEAQRTTPYGKIVLVQPPSLSILTVASVAFAGAIVLLFAVGSYTRHSTVGGQLLPDAGLIRIYSPRAGVVLERHVQENQRVDAGDVLFVVSGERPADAAGDRVRSELGIAGMPW